jgi:Tfp pilus assembly protein PilX
MLPHVRNIGIRGALRLQRGVVLFISLIVLVALSLAGIALVRSVDTNILIAGNLAFKQGATVAADSASETARRWLLASAVTSLYSDSTSAGYYSAIQTGFNPKTFNWTTGGKTLATDAAGYTSTYVIHRLCELSGDPSGIDCVKAGNSGKTGSSFGAVSYGAYALQLSGTAPAYRITTRVLGPKNTVSYVQEVVIP